MNGITLAGCLTANPEIRVAKNKDKTTDINFTITVHCDKETTDFINCAAFRETAELLEKYFSKGLRVAVDGSLTIEVEADAVGTPVTR